MRSWSITTTGVRCRRARAWSCRGSIFKGAGFVWSAYWGQAGSLSCLPERRLGAIHHLHVIVGEVFFGEGLHHLLPLIVEPAEFARLVAGQGVMGEDGHGDGGVGVAH